MKTLAELQETYLNSLEGVNLALQSYIADEITHQAYQRYYKAWCEAFDALSAHIDFTIAL